MAPSREKRFFGFQCEEEGRENVPEDATATEGLRREIELDN